MCEENIESIINAFHQALRKMDCETCRTLLAELAVVIKEAPDYQAQFDYLRGICARQCDRDWAEAERIFLTLLDFDLEPDLEGRVRNSLGITYRHLGRWSDALRVYEQALAVSDQSDQLLNRAKIWKNMATILDLGFTQGDFDQTDLQEAVTYCELALEALQTFDHQTEATLWLEAITWNTLGAVYQSLDHLSQAMTCYQKCITLGQQLNDRYEIAIATNNRAEIWQRQGRWDEAKQAFLAALETYRTFPDPYEESNVLRNLGTLHQEMEELDQALDYYGQALDQAETIQARLDSLITKTDFRITIDPLYTAPLSIQLQRHNLDEIFTLTERARSRTLADLLGDQTARPRFHPPQQWLAQEAKLRQQLDEAYMMTPPPANLSTLERTLADLERRIELAITEDTDHDTADNR